MAGHTPHTHATCSQTTQFRVEFLLLSRCGQNRKFRGVPAPHLRSFPRAPHWLPRLRFPSSGALTRTGMGLVELCVSESLHQSLKVLVDVSQQSDRTVLTFSRRVFTPVWSPFHSFLTSLRFPEKEGISPCFLLGAYALFATALCFIRK